MIINIGSKNDIKVNAVKETIRNYKFIEKAEVIGIETPSDVSEQPKSLQETIQGAINRAKNAFKECCLSFGLEDGLMHVPHTKTDYMNICVCAIYDGEEYHLGMASAFEYPIKATELVFKEGHDINQAFYKLGLTKNQKVGSSEGAIGILTKGRLTRKEHIKQAITMALIHLENAQLY